MRPFYAHPGTFAAGWNAACAGLPKNPQMRAEELDGWMRCMRYPASARVPFNQHLGTEG